MPSACESNEVKYVIFQKKFSTLKEMQALVNHNQLKIYQAKLCLLVDTKADLESNQVLLEATDRYAPPHSQACGGPEGRASGQ